MRFVTVAREFFHDLRAQRLRTTLTILGVTWGTVAVVVLLAFGVGFENQTRKRSIALGDGIVIMFGGRTTKAFAGFPDGRPIRYVEDDAALLAREIPDIAQISPEYSERNTPVRRGSEIVRPNITGIYPVYGDMRNIIPAAGGRFINQLDMKQRRRVVVLGDGVKQSLFGDEDAIGQDVFIGITPFTVIGVMVPKNQNSSYNSRDTDRMFIPAPTHQAVFGNRYVSNIVYKTTTPFVHEAVEERVYQVLGRKYRFDPSDEDALMIWDTAEMMKFLGAFFLGFKIFMAIVGSFTLTVGGIGVANIMYIVVRERTREIGIKRSVGARRRDILFQFFAETFLIVGVGAVLGFLISWRLDAVVGAIGAEQFLGRPTISGHVAVVTVALLAVIAFMAGLFPARRAANLDPVEAVRF